MGELSKLKVAVAQPELVDGEPSHNRATRERMMAQAIDAGADLLVMPGSLADEGAVHLVALNDSRIDVAGDVVALEAAGERYRISVGGPRPGCDFHVRADLSPWTCTSTPRFDKGGIVLRPTGMRNRDKNVLAFDGGTAVYAPDGTVLARLRDDFEEDFALVSLGERAEVAEPCKDKLLTALVKTVRRFDEQVLGGSLPWVIGLSGGLDSSIVAALLVLALGNGRVKGFNLASRYNSEATKGNAASLAEALGMSLRNGSIGDLVQATESTVRQYGYGGQGADALEGLTLENVQARIRGHLLSTFAALEGGVVANNGNRVECAFGYATLYGDAIGALAPIGDLTKTQLFKLARTINGQPGVGVIPENLLPRETDDGYEWEVMPSAELASDQVDPMKWFYHDWLVEQLLDNPSVDEGACRVLEGYLDDRLANTPVAKWVGYYGLQDPSVFLADFDWALAAIRRSAFKRIQAPPAVRVASEFSVRSTPEVQGVIEPSTRLQELHERVERLS